MEGERTGKCLHIFPVTVNQVMTKSINKMNVCIFILAQVQKNPAPAIQESNVLFIAGISSLITGLLAIVFVIAFVVICRKC